MTAFMHALAQSCSIAVYEPTLGTAPTQSLDGVDSVPLTLTDHPLILEL